ncbi:class I SAM-dependent methyltransferase [Candidatus Woesearchaeota archaeon]|nr:class I SAM-dependent methyltransferase [Candidatus Woesearchaeota archaeon]
MNKDFEFVNCDLCGSDSFKPERTLNSYKLVKCRNCGFVFVNPRLKQELIIDAYNDKNKYSDDIHVSDENKLKNYYESIEDERKPDYLRKIDIIKKIKGDKKLKLLDVGCGDLSFLRLAKQHDFDVYGTEVIDWPKDIAKKYKIPLYIGTLDKIDFKNNSFDIVYANHVFEHLTDPSSILKRCYSILKPQGLIMIDVPNYNALSIRLGIDDFHNNLPPGHLNYFTPKILKKYLLKKGFKDITIISEWLRHKTLRKLLLYDKSKIIKKLIKKSLNQFKGGYDLLIIARKY